MTRTTSSWNSGNVSRRIPKKLANPPIMIATIKKLIPAMCFTAQRTIPFIKELLFYSWVIVCLAVRTLSDPSPMRFASGEVTIIVPG